MQYISCGRGHYYNPEEHASCPQCARENATQGGGAPDGREFEWIPETTPTDVPWNTVDELPPTTPANGDSWTPDRQPGTVPLGGVDPVGPTEPADGWPSSPPASKKSAQTVDPVPGKVQDYGDTAPVSPGFYGVGPGARPVNIQPTVGWLVCVNGAAKGRDFRIHSQYNYIGRARHMDICIEGDNSISSERAAILAYDDQQRIFFFAPGQGRNLVRVNDRAVLTSVELQAYDRITIGRSTFLFVPLCGERFDWNEQER